MLFEAGVLRSKLNGPNYTHFPCITKVQVCKFTVSVYACTDGASVRMFIQMIENSGGWCPIWHTYVYSHILLGGTASVSLSVLHTTSRHLKYSYPTS
jgi:hypothetical protein